MRQQLINVTIGREYPVPVIDHATQRALALSLYKNANVEDTGSAGNDDVAA